MARESPTPPPKRRKKSELCVDNLFVTIDSGLRKSYVIDENLVQFSLAIPHKLLFSWNKSDSKHCSYIELANGKVLGSAVQLRVGNERIENRLAQQARKVSSEISKAAGRRRESLLDRQYHLVVMKDETESFADTEKKLQDTTTTLSSKEQHIAVLLKEMTDLADEASVANPSFKNKGKPIEDTSPRQARRKLAHFKTNAEKALWFAESFGLVPDCITLRKAKSGSCVMIPLSENAQDSQCTSNISATQVQDTEKLFQVLYILDRFAVSDEAYHEIRMCSCKTDSSALPPLYTLKQARKQLGSSMEIERFQGGYPGAFRPLLDILTREITRTVCFKTISNNDIHSHIIILCGLIIIYVM